jgi:hypothetical protein
MFTFGSGSGPDPIKKVATLGRICTVILLINSYILYPY